jgi:hypothetical protein
MEAEGSASEKKIVIETGRIDPIDSFETGRDQKPKKESHL